MAFTYAHGLVLAAAAAAASLLAVSMADIIIVGGASENWHFGFNYSDWAQNTPFYLHDTLVFKYDPPSNTTAPHNVYLFPDDPLSYFNCDFKGAKLIANTTQGGGDGFQFVLNDWNPYYFACGVGNGTHCNEGGMRFIAHLNDR